MANNNLILDVQFGFDPKATYEFEEVSYAFNEETETLRAMYGDDFRG